MSNPLQDPSLHSLSAKFEWNARHSFHGGSALYEELALRIANDPEILDIAGHAPAHQPSANLLFASVLYLLLRGGAEASPLAAFYPSLTLNPNSQDDPYPFFRAFCLEHVEDIQRLMQTRRVQTNEVARCAFFLPAFGMIARRIARKRFALVEVGCSAGLNLLWDEYAYDYGDGQVYGRSNSPVHLKCELRGEGHPPLPCELPHVTARIGIDLNPNDVQDEDAMLWLRALLWPEQRDRAERLEQALALARQHPPRLIKGDVLEALPQVLEEIPNNVPVCVLHSFVLNQIPAEARKAYYTLLQAFAAERQLFDLAIEPQAWPPPLVLTAYELGAVHPETLAICDHHGRWMEWQE